MHIYNGKPKHSGAGMSSTDDVLKAFWQGARFHKVALLLTLGGISVSRVIDIVVPIFYKRFFDVLNAETILADKSKLLLNIIMVIFALNVIIWIFYRVMSFANSHFQAMTMAKLRQQAFEYMVDHSYAFYANNFTGSLVQRVNRFSRAFERLMDRLTFNIIPLIIHIAGVSLVLWFTNPMITMVLLIWVVFFLAFNYFFASWKLKYDVRRASADSFTTGVLSDAITNQNTIQLFTGKESEANYFEKVTNEQARITRLSWNLDGVVDAVQSFLIFTIEFLLFYFAIRYWQAGQITVGTFVLIQVYLVGLGGKLWDFSRVIRDIYESFADAKEMVDIIKLPHDIKDRRGAGKLIVSAGEVRFSEVSFGFNDDRTVLKDIDLAIKPGEKVALIGPSGAGKSTFVKLLFRLYDATNGVISIDGHDVKTVTQESLRESLSLVPQDPILFHRTLLENIRYGKRCASDAEVLSAAALAHCDEFALSLPTGYNTYVGERGVKLSGGERQRVAIARAILKNAPILVLDEATSSLDSHSESLIQDALDKLMKGKTTIVIAHRLSTIRKMDRIIVLEKGKIIEEGSHDELLQNDSSLYKKLWTLQAGGFIR